MLSVCVCLYFPEHAHTFEFNGSNENLGMKAINFRYMFQQLGPLQEHLNELKSISQKIIYSHVNDPPREIILWFFFYI